MKIIDVKDEEGSGYKVKGVKKYKFKQSHPGYKFNRIEASYYTQDITNKRKTMSNGRTQVTFNQSNSRFA
jgi:hypothetical protein